MNCVNELLPERSAEVAKTRPELCPWSSIP